MRKTYLTELLLSSAVPIKVKQALLELMDRERIHYDVQVLTPTATNDDVNGSAHVADGGTDFTYQDATENDAAAATSLGYYEYFSDCGYGTYTGHYYNGSSSKFVAVVIDPPAYAATVHI